MPQHKWQLSGTAALISAAVALQFQETSSHVPKPASLCFSPKPLQRWRPDGRWLLCRQAVHEELPSRRTASFSAAAVATSAAVAVLGALGARKAAAASGVVIPGVDNKPVQIPRARTEGYAWNALDGIKLSPSWPYTAQDFFRFDRSDDALFYETPKLVKHVDDAALAALTDYYKCVFPGRPFSALDICSSWVSHYPDKPTPTRLAITGMNEEELRRNKQATEFKVQDLNVDPRLPFQTADFDVVTNTVSVDYLTKPREVFAEVARVLKPGGLATVAWSNRCFLTKCISMWSGKGPDEQAEIVASYFHYAGGFGDASVVDISPGGQSDPMYVVSAVRI